MILKGSQRGGARQLGDHLLKKTENEHVEVHEVRGFMASDLLGALREAEAISRGTRCKQFLFSVSLNPPQKEDVRIETFEEALAAIEEKNGLTGQPRVVVFHEKEGRRHCHAVWSRIDAESMTARPLPFFKNRLREVSKQLYLEHGWQMPRGLMDSKERDPRNFTLDEWQQAKRIGRHAGELKSLIQECWAVSDSRAAFAKALEERGLYLAKGDRRAHIALTFEGEAISIPKALGKKTKEVTARLGATDDLASVEQTRQRIATDILPRLKSHMDGARAQAVKELTPLDERRRAMRDQHAAERAKVDAGQQVRQEQETRERAGRMRRGMAGLWDRLTGTYAKFRKQNELEALWALQRDREQRHALLHAQQTERQSLQQQIQQARNRHADRLRELHRDAANYRLMQKGEPPKAKSAFDRLEELRSKPTPQASVEFQKAQGREPLSPKEREERLRKKGPERPPDHDLDR
tara:strand:- start:3082 stop:4479 length:1398 start_codon:yes stop_codon:yes gene_type:complete